MNILQLIVYLAVLCMVFTFFWKWAVVFPVSLLFSFRLGKGAYILKGLGVYFLFSAACLLTLAGIGSEPGWLRAGVFSLVGLFVLYVGLGSTAYEAQKEARATFDWELLRSLRHDFLFLFGGLGLFLFGLMFPFVVANPVSLSVLKLTVRALELPVMGFLLKTGGILVFFATTWHALMFLFMFGGFIFRLFKKTSGPDLAGR